MKIFTRILLSLLFCGSLAAQQPQVTTPVVGFLTLQLQAGNNFLGFALLPAMEVQGAFNISAGDRTHIFLQGAPQLALTNDQFNTGPKPTHVIEIVSAGAAQGFTSVITDTIATGNEIVLESAIPAGVVDGAQLKVWRLWTLAEAFGATNSAGLTGGTTADTADIILLPKSGGGYDQYFYSTGGVQGAGWRMVDGGTTAQDNVPVQFTGGAAIRARSAKSIIITGQVKPGNTQVQLQTGRNIVVNLCPVNAAGTTPSSEGRTLGNSGLQAGIAGAAASALADLVLLADGAGYTQYYYSTGGLLGTGWRKVGSGQADQAGVALPDGAFIILRRGAPTSLVLNQGSF